MIFFAESTFEELKSFCSKNETHKQDFKPLWFWVQFSDECHGIYNCLSSQNLLRMLVKPSSSNDLWTKELKDIQALLQGSLSTNAEVSFEQKHKTITRLFRPMDRKLSRLNRRYKTARTQNKVKSVNDDLRRIWNLEHNDGDCKLKTQSRQQQGETCMNKVNSVFVSGISDPVVSAEISSENTCILSDIDACKNMNSSGDCENKNSNVRCQAVTETAIGNNTNINSDSPLSTAIESDSLYENNHSGSDRIKDETSMKQLSAEKRNKSTPIPPIDSRMENFLKRAKKIRKFYGKDFPGSVAAAQSISTLSDELQLGADALILFWDYWLADDDSDSEDQTD